MNWKSIFRVLGDYLFMFSATLAFGFALSLYYQFYVPRIAHPAHHASFGFAMTGILCLVTAAAFKIWSREEERSPIQLREGLLIVLAVWVLTSIFGALPFNFSGTLDHFIDSWFESVSGLTTTGSSILHAKLYNDVGEELPIHYIYSGFQKVDYTFYGTVAPAVDAAGKTVLVGIEAVPKALIFWRSFLHWYGGMGIVLLFVAFLPLLGAQGRTIFRYESTGPMFAPLFPRVRDTAIVLLQIYLFLTAANILALLITNPSIPLFDAICVAFSTISTGGFAPRNASVGTYNSAATDFVTIFFMAAGGINFALYYDVLKGRFYKIFEPEFLTYIGLLLGLSGIAAWGIYGAPKILLTGPLPTPEHYNFFDSIRYGAFQVVTCMTNTGFSTCDYDQWPFISQAMMLVSMYLGGMAGSTSGGLKIIRVCILWQCMRHGIISHFRRSEVRLVRVGAREIGQETIIGVLTIFLIMVAASLVGVLLLIANGVDPETSLGLNGCMINNTGSSFRAAGPTESCAFLSPFSKTVCIIWMFIGRLEYYAWFAVLLPSFWKKR
jgi:trk system potassium uptake protein TrkH